MSAQNTTAAIARQSQTAGTLALDRVLDGSLGLLTTAHQITDLMEKLRPVANILSPFTRPGMLAKGYAVSYTAVTIDSSVDRFGNGSECYRGSFMKDDERALNRVGLRRVANGIGIEWLSYPHSRQVPDDHPHPYVCTFTVEGLYRNVDGSVGKCRGTAKVDFRDGSDQIGGWTPKAWAELLEINRAAMKKGTPKGDLDWNIGGWSEQRVKMARQKVLERAETAAQNRAIRDYGLDHKYTVPQLARPFVCFKATFVPDMDDPNIKALVTMANLSGLSQIYPQALPPGGAAPMSLAPAPDEVIDAGPDAADVIEHEVAKERGGATVTQHPAARQEPAPTEPARRARTVITVGQYPGGDRGHFVVLDGGEVLRTDEAIAKAAAPLVESKRPVFVETEKRDHDHWLIELEFADAAAEATPEANDAEDPNVYVTAIDTKKNGETDGRKWTIWKITMSTGQVLTRIGGADDKVHGLAVRALESKLPVRFESEPSERYAGQVDLKSLRVVDGEPDLPFGR